MTLPTVECLRELSRDELIALVLKLAERLGRLEAEIKRFKGPPTTSRNSSQPPSRDWKPDTPTGKRGRRRKRGAKPGHAKADRPLVEKPDSVIEARVASCAGCGADLQAVAPERILRRQVTELPEIKPVVIETQQHEVVCPGCQCRQRGSLPAGLEAERRFGPRLEGLVTYFHHEQHLSFQRLQTVLRDVFGTRLSEGGEVAILKRAGAAAQLEADAIRRLIEMETSEHGAASALGFPEGRSLRDRNPACVRPDRLQWRLAGPAGGAPCAGIQLPSPGHL